MTIAHFMTGLAGVLALLGLVGIFGGAWARRSPHRHASFRAGSVAMGSAGLVLLSGSLVGAVDTGQLFGGVMLILFATAISLPVTDQPAARASRT